MKTQKPSLLVLHIKNNTHFWLAMDDRQTDRQIGFRYETFEYYYMMALLT